MANGSYDGWTPRALDLYRLQFETLISIDKDGIISSAGGPGRPSTRASSKITDPPPQTTIPPTEQGAGQLNTECNGTTVVEPTQLNGFSPIDFLANSTSFPPRAPVSDQVKCEGSDQPPELDENDAPSLLSMEFMVYNDLMTDIGGTARFFDKNFRNSVLFEPTPPEDTGFVQGMGFQTPGTVYE